MVQIDNLAIERAEITRKHVISTKNGSSVNLTLRDLEAAAANNILAYSGATALLDKLKTSFDGFDLKKIVHTENGDVKASILFKFDYKKYVPKIVKKEPWEEWRQCEVSASAYNEHVSFKLANYKDGYRANLLIAEAITNQKDLPRLFEKSLIIPRNAVKYPDTGIDHSLYDSFRADIFAASDFASSTFHKRELIIQEILSSSEYAPIVRKHFKFFLDKDNRET